MEKEGGRFSASSAEEKERGGAGVEGTGGGEAVRAGVEGTSSEAATVAENAAEPSSYRMTLESLSVTTAPLRSNPSNPFPPPTNLSKVSLTLSPPPPLGLPCTANFTALYFPNCDLATLSGFTAEGVLR